MTAADNETPIPAPLEVRATAVTIVTEGQTPGERTAFNLKPCCPTPEQCTHILCDCKDRTTCEHPVPDPDAVARNGVLVAVRPKNMLLMLIGQRVTQGNESADPAGKLPAYRVFLDAAVEPETNAIIWARIGDPTDSLDDSDLDALIDTFMGRWMPGNPTLRAAASGRLPRTTGRPSTGRSRSTGKTRKS